MVSASACAPRLAEPLLTPAVPRAAPASRYNRQSSDSSDPNKSRVGTPVSMHTESPQHLSRRRTLPKAARLLRPAEFASVFKNGERMQNRFFSIIHAQSHVAGRRCRLGIAVSKKNVRLAVARNRLKRIIREWFRTTNLSSTGDIIVMARPGSGSASPHQLRQSLANMKLGSRTNGNSGP